VVALAIACTKMTLVVLFFMHVKYTKLTKLTVASGFFVFIVLIGMTMTVLHRAWDAGRTPLSATFRLSS